MEEKKRGVKNRVDAQPPSNIRNDSSAGVVRWNEKAEEYSVEKLNQAIKSINEKTLSSIDGNNFNFTSEKKQELESFVKEERKQKRKDAEGAKAAIQECLDWIQGVKTAYNEADWKSKRVIETVIYKGFEYIDSSSSSPNSTDYSEVQEDTVKIELEDKKVMKDNINNFIDMLLEETDVEKKQEIQKQLKNQIDALLDKVDVENKDEIKKILEDKIKLLVEETNVSEKEKIAKEIKNDINLITETANVIENKTKELNELKDKKQNIDEQVRIKEEEIDSKIDELDTQKIKIDEEKNEANAKIGEEIAEKSELKNNAEADSEEEAKLTEEIEELQQKLIDNETKAEEEKAKLDAEIEKLNASKATLKDDITKELDEQIGKIEDEIKETNEKLVSQLKEENSASTSINTSAKVDDAPTENKQISDKQTTSEE